MLWPDGIIICTFSHLFTIRKPGNGKIFCARRDPHSNGMIRTAILHQSLGIRTTPELGIRTTEHSRSYIWTYKNRIGLHAFDTSSLKNIVQQIKKHNHFKRAFQNELEHLLCPAMFVNERFHCHSVQFCSMWGIPGCFSRNL